jgi:phosphatidate cytidylyltransferase
LFPLAVGAILIGGSLLKFLLLAMYFQVQYELLGFTPSLSPLRRRILAIASLLLPLGYFCFGYGGAAAGAVLFVLLGTMSEVIVVETEPHQIERGESLGLIALATAYTGVLGTAMAVSASEARPKELFFVLFSVIAADTAAYFAGRAFGRHALAPRISPKKTLEGAAGGLAGSMLAAGVSSYCFELPLPLALSLCFGLLIGVLALFGDLLESLVKRCYGKKDSGELLPGHGGLLDRIDAMLAASSVLFLLRLWRLG